MKKNLSVLFLFYSIFFSFLASTGYSQQTENDPARVEWFHQLGYGLFIHWGIDGQIGTVISHSLVGASDDYTQRYFNELPGTFNPDRFNPDEWARLAKVSGIKYMVFTAKHHSGFCMFNTKTTSFNVMNTPYGEDITKEVIDAFRKQGIAIGLYFSPDDFHYLYENGITISRARPEVFPRNNKGLMALDKMQLRELLTQYGDIDILFIDGPYEGVPVELREYAWEINPKLIITRGAMKTPEIAPSTSDSIPSAYSFDVWEACFTMGASWAYNPANQNYQSGSKLIKNLIEVRAKNGNMLLNIGPKPNGEISQKQEDLLREIGTWIFINREAVYEVAPRSLAHEQGVWFLKSKDGKSIFAILEQPDVAFGERKRIVLNSVRATKKTFVSVLGQNDKVIEYHPGEIPKTVWENTNDGLAITFYRAQRIYNDRSWSNPVVLKIQNPVEIQTN